jgi:hypothetical protein
MCWEAQVRRFHYKVRNRSTGILAESDLEEVDVISAYRALSTAASIFVGRGKALDAWLELEDEAGAPLAKVSLKKLAKLDLVEEESNQRCVVLSAVSRLSN